jgi:hypothetical protein
VVLLVIFWTIPVTFVSSLVNLDSLSEKLPFLKAFVEHYPTFQNFLAGFLSSIVFIIFQAILPAILYGLFFPPRSFLPSFVDNLAIWIFSSLTLPRPFFKHMDPTFCSLQVLLLSSLELLPGNGFGWRCLCDH